MKDIIRINVFYIKDDKRFDDAHFISRANWETQPLIFNTEMFHIAEMIKNAFSNMKESESVKET